MKGKARARARVTAQMRRRTATGLGRTPVRMNWGLPVALTHTWSRTQYRTAESSRLNSPPAMRQSRKARTAYSAVQ